MHLRKIGEFESSKIVDIHSEEIRQNAWNEM